MFMMNKLKVTLDQPVFLYVILLMNSTADITTMILK